MSKIMVEWVDKVSSFISAFPRFLDDKKRPLIQKLSRRWSFFECKAFLRLNGTKKWNMSTIGEVSSRLINVLKNTLKI